MFSSSTAGGLQPGPTTGNIATAQADAADAAIAETVVLIVRVELKSLRPAAV